MATSVKLVTNGDIQSILKYEDLIPVIEEGLKDFSDKQIHQPLRTVITLHEHDGFFAAMPAYNARKNVLAIKCLSFHAENSKQQLATHNSQILLYNPTNGILLALMDGDVITEMRTAAASAVASKYLAKSDSKVLAVIGAGVQARSHIFALIGLVPLKKVYIYNRTKENGIKLCESFKNFASSIHVCDTAEEAVIDADIIVTATSSKTPVLHGKWLKEGVHINCIGACRPDWRELDDCCMEICEVYVDSKTAALAESGDIILSKKEIKGEIGELILGKVKVNRNKRTLFKSLGIAVEDAVTSDLVWQLLQ